MWGLISIYSYHILLFKKRYVVKLEHSGEMMETTVTVRFPKPVYRSLNRQAKVFNRPLDDIVVQTVKKGLPFWMDAIPPDFESELAQLGKLTPAQLQKIAKGKLSGVKQKKLDKLLQKNSAGTITLKEIEELDSLQLEVDLLTLKKAQALAFLYERGCKLPLHKYLCQ